MMGNRYLRDGQGMRATGRIAQGRRKWRPREEKRQAMIKVTKAALGLGVILTKIYGSINPAGVVVTTS